MTQSEFTEVLENEISPFVSDIISYAPLHSDKFKYFRESCDKLDKKLSKYNFPQDTYRELYVKYQSKIEGKILG